MRDLDRGVTEEERYWHGLPWAICWTGFIYLSYRTVYWGRDGDWLSMGLAALGAIGCLGTVEAAKKKFYLRRRNAQARQEVKF